MKKRIKAQNKKVKNVAIVVFYDNNLNIIVQERGDHSRLGEKYGFFGGGIENGEIPEQTIKRELLEEIGFVPEKLDYWIKDSFNFKEKNWLINRYVFLSPITLELENAEITEGEGMIKMNINEAIKEKGFIIGDINLLKKLNIKLKKVLKENQVKVKSMFYLTFLFL